MRFLEMVCAVLFTAPADVQTVNQLLDAWGNGCRAIRSYDLYVSGEVKTFLDPLRGRKPREQVLFDKGSSHQVLSQGKRRIEPGVVGPGQEAKIVFVWNQVAKYYSRGFQLNIDSNFTPSSVFDYEALYRCTGNMDWIPVMRDRPNTTLERQVGGEFVIYTPPTNKPVNYSPFGLRVWLDSRKNFLPTKIQHLLNESGKEIVSAEFRNTLTEVAPAVWAVTESAFSNFPPILQTESPPKEATVGTVKVNMRLSKFNCDIPESAFEIVAPTGTTVYDKVLGTRYVIGKTTPAEIRLAAFNVKGAPLDRFDNACRDARLARQHVLIIFAPTATKITEQLFFMTDDREKLGDTIDDFRRLWIGTDADRLATAQILAKNLRLDIQADAGPLLVTTDERGKPLAAKKAEDLSKDGKLDAALVRQFLENAAPKHLDAEQLLNDALAQAKKENKRVIVQETAISCPPCWLLTRFLDKHRDVWEKDYLWIKLDSRWANAEAIGKRLRQKAQGGIPWTAILDADGKVLATSNDKEGANIGFPQDPAAIGHFAAMLRATAQRLTAADIAQLTDALEPAKRP
jgi:hypothetical protein